MKKHIFLAASLLMLSDGAVAQDDLCPRLSPTEAHKCVENYTVLNAFALPGSFCLYDESASVCYRRELRDGGNYVYKYHPTWSGIGSPKPVTPAEDWFYIRTKTVDSMHLILFFALTEYPEYPYQRVEDSK